MSSIANTLPILCLSNSGAGGPAQYGGELIGRSPAEFNEIRLLGAIARPRYTSHMCWSSDTIFNNLAKYASWSLDNFTFVRQWFPSRFCIFSVCVRLSLWAYQLIGSWIALTTLLVFRFDGDTVDSRNVGGLELFV